MYFRKRIIHREQNLKRNFHFHGFHEIHNNNAALGARPVDIQRDFENFVAFDAVRYCAGRIGTADLEIGCGGNWWGPAGATFAATSPRYYRHSTRLSALFAEASSYPFRCGITKCNPFLYSTSSYLLAGAVFCFFFPLCVCVFFLIVS